MFVKCLQWSKSFFVACDHLVIQYELCEKIIEWAHSFAAFTGSWLSNINTYRPMQKARCKLYPRDINRYKRKCRFSKQQLFSAHSLNIPPLCMLTHNESRDLVQSLKYASTGRKDDVRNDADHRVNWGRELKVSSGGTRWQQCAGFTVDEGIRRHLCLEAFSTSIKFSKQPI